VTAWYDLTLHILSGLISTKLSRRALASFEYHKSGKKYRVNVYLLRATHVSAKWPEKKSRQRKWLPLNVSVARLKHTAMAKAVQTAFT
jgi:hypothetical protein